jgi:hypothetical protein
LAAVLAWGVLPLPPVWQRLAQQPLALPGPSRRLHLREAKRRLAVLMGLLGFPTA